MTDHDLCHASCRRRTNVEDLTDPRVAATVPSAASHDSRSTTPDQVFRFGPSMVNVATRSVLHDGQARHLEPQAFDLLAYLVTHRERVVPKTELLDEVWGDQFVSESALTTRIKEVRRAVGDDGNRQSVVKNFRGRGYRFVSEVEEPGAGGETANSPDSWTTSLLGRGDDIAATMRLLDDSRVVTLVGPGGVGKTSLARDVGRRRRRMYADGVAVVRLATVREPGAVRHALRSATGLDDSGVDDHDLIAAVADLDALIVLDNCEHVIDEVAHLVGAISERAGRVRVLATSRERLGLSAEVVWPVDPLCEKTARRLLLERAQSAQPGYTFPVGSDVAVTALLEKLDRLPLAIEMAAARLPSVGLDELVGFLDERLELLGTVDRSADDRHRTIDGLIRWSEELLDDDARHVLTCLSTFAGAATASDIAVVAERDSAAVAVGALATCVDQSLIVVDRLSQPTTYRLLETVRARAAQRRTNDHEARHARHVIGVATEMDRTLRTPDEPAAARRLDALAADLRLAHAWAREHDPDLAGELTAALTHYAYERQWTEPVAWANDLAGRVDPDSPSALAAAAVRAADHNNRGEFDRAEALARRALASDDPRVVKSAHDTLGNIGLYTGDVDMLHRHAVEMRDIGQRDGDTPMLAGALILDAMALAYGDRPEDALEHLERHAITLPLSPTSAAWIAYTEADTLSALGREREAIERFDDSIRLGTSVGSRFVVSVAELSALAARGRVHDVDAARAAFVPVLKHYRRIRSLTHAITALRNLVELLVRAGDDETAMVLLGAVSTPHVKSTYGVESQRLGEARSTVEERTEPGRVEEWIAHGAAHDPIWAIDHAVGVLS